MITGHLMILAATETSAPVKIGAIKLAGTTNNKTIENKVNI